MTDNQSQAVDYSSRYGLNPAHSEVVQACARIDAGSALDMGCGSGRNALYLAARGFEVTAVDSNPAAVARLQSIVQAEGLDRVDARVYDINEARLEGPFDFIACTVTLMFLDPGRVEAVIEDMQRATRPGGYNLVVAAMDTPAMPCPVGFPFTLAEGQLSGWYSGWQLPKYNEDPGTLHSGARMQFATMLARKPD